MISRNWVSSTNNVVNVRVCGQFDLDIPLHQGRDKSVYFMTVFDYRLNEYHQVLSKYEILMLQSNKIH